MWLIIIVVDSRRVFHPDRGCLGAKHVSNRGFWHHFTKGEGSYLLVTSLQHNQVVCLLLEQRMYRLLHMQLPLLDGWWRWRVGHVYFHTLCIKEIVERWQSRDVPGCIPVVCVCVCVRVRARAVRAFAVYS